MSTSEEDIQASASITHLKPKSLLGDTAHHFRNRTVLAVSGDLSAIADIASSSAPASDERPKFIALLDEHGHLDADLYVIPQGDGVLIDIHRDLLDSVAARLEGLEGVEAVDREAGRAWRVFGELPDQRGGETPFQTIRFADGRRREMGNRVLREAAEPEGLDWRHSRKWDGHAMRLGLLPDHRCVTGKAIRPEEAGYHRLLGIEPQGDPVKLTRRILPVRIEPNAQSLPVMINAPILADGTQIATMLDQEGVCGIALVQLQPWREALAAGAKISCLDEPALISWPTWLSSESDGRVGPAGHLI